MTKIRAMVISNENKKQDDVTKVRSVTIININDGRCNPGMDGEKFKIPDARRMPFSILILLIFQ